MHILDCCGGDGGIAESIAGELWQIRAGGASHGLPAGRSPSDEQTIWEPGDRQDRLKIGPVSSFRSGRAVDRIAVPAPYDYGI